MYKYTLHVSVTDTIIVLFLFSAHTWRIIIKREKKGITVKRRQVLSFAINPQCMYKYQPDTLVDTAVFTATAGSAILAIKVATYRSLYLLYFFFIHSVTLIINHKKKKKFHNGLDVQNWIYVFIINIWKLCILHADFSIIISLFFFFFVVLVLSF